jgi:hypothetical protein
MRHRRTRRPLALFALALALFAALPCAALAGEESCCGAAASCGESSQSPCAQLAQTPCCKAGGAPLELSPVAKTSEPPPQLALDLGDFPMQTPRSAGFMAPAARSSELALRSVVLRL